MDRIASRHRCDRGSIPARSIICKILFFINHMKKNSHTDTHTHSHTHTDILFFIKPMKKTHTQTHTHTHTHTHTQTHTFSLGCFIFSLFLSFGLCFFFLCTNVIKSCQKKFGVHWRSFDPPTKTPHYVIKSQNAWILTIFAFQHVIYRWIGNQMLINNLNRR